MKSELAYSGMLVKELAARSGVNKYSIDNYLNKRGQLPSVDAAVKIAAALGVSVEYLVTGKDRADHVQASNKTRAVMRLTEQLSEKNRQFVLDFIQWIKEREEGENRGAG